jgi:hypothetical protein
MQLNAGPHKVDWRFCVRDERSPLSRDDEGYSLQKLGIQPARGAHTMKTRYIVWSLFTLLLVLGFAPIVSAQVDTLQAAFRGLERFDGPYSMHLKDHYLVTTMDFGGEPIFATFDISGDDPELVAKTERSQHDIRYNDHTACVGDLLIQSEYDDWGYWEDELIGLFVLDISDPMHPVESYFPDTPVLGHLIGSIESTVFGFVQDSNRSYVVAWDISDPSSPDSLTSTPKHLDGSTREIVVCDGYIAVADWLQVRFYDVHSMELIGSFFPPTYQSPYGIAYANDHLYISVGENYLGFENNAPALEVLNMLDPANPILLDPLLLEKTIGGIWEIEGALHGRDHSGSYVIINIDEPGNPVAEIITMPYDLPYHMDYIDSKYDFAVSGDLIYSMFGNNLTARNMSDFSLIGMFTYYDFADNYYQYLLVNENLYIPTSRGLHYVVINLNDPQNPVESGIAYLPEFNYRVGGLVTGGEWLHSYSYDNHQPRLFYSFNVSDPLIPEHIISREVDLKTRDNGITLVKAKHNYLAYAIAGSNEIEVDGELQSVCRDTLVIENMSDQSITHNIPAEDIKHFILTDTHCFFFSGACSTYYFDPYNQWNRNDLYVISLSDQEAEPRLVYEDLDSEDPLLLEYGHHLIIRERDQLSQPTLVTLDISDPYNPTTVSEIEEVEYGLALNALENGIVYKGLLLDDHSPITNIFTPNGIPAFELSVVVGNYQVLSPIHGIVIHDDILYRATEHFVECYDISQYIYPDQEIEYSGESGAYLEFGYVYPNPSNTESNLVFHMPTFGNVKVDLYNILGQRVLSRTTYQLPGWQTLSLDMTLYASGHYAIRYTFPDGDQHWQRVAVVH